MIFVWFSCFTIQAQILGCMDKKSLNYNPKATVNDGSCQFKKTKIDPIESFDLDKKLNETSGLIQWNNRLWTHNDDTDTNLYALDTINGSILETYNLPNVVNTDWEEISQDEKYLYVGDFGNNKGNRTNLHILRVEKKSLLERKPIIDTIAYKYPNQINFGKQKTKTTNFDCEALIITNDSIYLFSKEWKNKQTTIYALPKIPGNYIAYKKDSFNVKGVITGVNYLPSKKIIVLCGYTKKGKSFLHLFYDFNNNNFFSANHRKLNFNFNFQQIEGVSTRDGLKYYITNENLKFLTVNNPQKMHILDLRDYL